MKSRQVALVALLLFGCGRHKAKEPVVVAAPPPPAACQINGPGYAVPAPGPLDPKPTAPPAPAPAAETAIQ